MSARVPRAAALLFLLLATPVRAQDSGASVAALVTPQEGRLKNGLRVLSLVDSKAAVSTFQVWYDTGSRNERPGITGISHLFEHLMFKGTKKVAPEEHARLVQNVGGINNAIEAALYARRKGRGVYMSGSINETDQYVRVTAYMALAC